MREPWVTRVLLLGFALQAMLSLASLGGYLRLATRLVGRPLAERGFIAADAFANPLGQAGHMRLRESLAAVVKVPVSKGPDVWRWALATRSVIGDRGRVWLNAPHLSAFFIASFMWYPGRMVVDTGGAPVTDEGSLRNALRPLDKERLSRLAGEGYTHALLANGAGGLRLLGLQAVHRQLPAGRPP